MGNIHQLPEEIVAKIAAGEVIERPSFAVKELIENAIDAGANTIDIILEDAGLAKIQIIDNGEGMSEEDITECWKPHTTSKLTEDHPLVGIRSFGFRGEALASIAAISTLSIKSRQKTATTGNEIKIHDGKFVFCQPAGMPYGTIITIENLFTSVPARKKFLKSPQTELRHIIETVTAFSIAYPTIQFTLTHNKKLLLSTSQEDTTIERITPLLNVDTLSLLLPVKHTQSHIQITGYIAKPQITTTTSAKQLVFINKRKVHDRTISLAVKEAYGTMLEPTTFPIFVLFLEMPYEMVDVNVHPRKEQVNFLNPKAIFNEVKATIGEVLSENNITFQNLSWKRNGVGTTNTYAARKLRGQVLSAQEEITKELMQPVQLYNLYLLTADTNGLSVIDQHAAHERILFEKLKQAFLKEKEILATYELPTPIVLRLSAAEKVLIDEHRELLSKIGFRIKDNLLTHIPDLYQDRDPHELLRHLLERFTDELPLQGVDTVSEEMLAFLACRTAVKAGDKLEEKQVQEIIETIDKTPNAATCPHGRPTKVALSLSDINHLFKR